MIELDDYFWIIKINWTKYVYFIMFFKVVYTYVGIT